MNSGSQIVLGIRAKSVLRCTRRSEISGLALVDVTIVAIEDGYSSAPRASWVDVSQDAASLVGQLPYVGPTDLAGQLRQLVSDIPAKLQVCERIVTHAIVSNVLGKTACMTGIARLPEVACAFVLWAAAGPTSDSLSADACRIAASCAVALESMAVYLEFAAVVAF